MLNNKKGGCMNVALLALQIPTGIAFAKLVMPYGGELAERVNNLFENEVPEISREEIEAIEKYKKEVKSNYFEVVVLAPYLEELLFRGVLEGALDIGLEALGVPLPLLMSAFLTSMTFGGLHYFRCKGSYGVISATVSGLGLSLLRNTIGGPAAIAAHMTHNWLCLNNLEDEEKALTG